MSYSFALNKKKWVATIVVATFFLYFWAFGPLQSVVEPLFESEKDKHYVKPVLIPNEPTKLFTGSKTVGDMETEGEGYKLIIDSKKPKIKSRVIELESNAATTTEYGENLLKNARFFCKYSGVNYSLKQTEQLFYVEAKWKDKRYFYVQSKGITNHIKGYSGPINVGLFLNEDAQIESIHLVSSSETKSYLEKINRTHYYSQYNHQNLTKIHQVDAISGATITTEAIALTVSELVNTAYPNPIENLTDEMGISNYAVTAELTLKWVFHIGVIFILFGYAFQKKWRKSKRFVILSSVAALVYIGFFLNESFTYVTFIHPFIGTSLSSFMGLYALFVILGAIWGKNTYCKYICPYGNVQRLQLRLTKGLNKKFFLKKKQIKQIRFTILFFLIVGILAGMRNLSHLEPFPYLFGFEIESLWYFIFAVLGLLANWIYPMIWCRLLCPTGSILDTVSLIINKNNHATRIKSIT